MDYANLILTYSPWLVAGLIARFVQSFLVEQKFNKFISYFIVLVLENVAVLYLIFNNNINLAIPYFIASFSAATYQFMCDSKRFCMFTTVNKNQNFINPLLLQYFVIAFVIILSTLL
jgi:hypothetical protein